MLKAGRIVMLVSADGRTSLLRMAVPLSERLEITLFRTATCAEMSVTFIRRGLEYDHCAVYEEVSCQVKVT